MRTELPKSFLDRANQNISTKFKGVSSPVTIGDSLISCPYERQYVLRMMIRNKDWFFIPDELSWMKPQIYELERLQKWNRLDNPFIYVTVCHGIVTSELDDDWHVDGFSTRFEHLPEQNYICSSVNPTEYLEQSFDIPSDFDPLKHNIHTFYQDRADNSKVRQCEANKVHLIDPYCVHRRPKGTNGIVRTFWRISFIPIEIEDDTCTINNLMPFQKKYGRKDIRETLTRYI